MLGGHGLQSELPFLLALMECVVVTPPCVSLIKIKLIVGLCN